MQQPVTEQNPELENQNPENIIDQVEEQKPKKTYFKTHKELGDPFFKNSRITSNT